MFECVRAFRFEEKTANSRNGKMKNWARWERRATQVTEGYSSELILSVP